MSDIKNYAVVTASYWGFTVTDGALRMLVLLHFHALGYKPLDLAYLFLLYELMGVFTNFFGGWIGARFGLRLTLFSGLGVQVVSLVMLAAMPPGMAAAASVFYVMAAQALSGIAKDLTKMSSKSAVKLLAPEDGRGLLFKWIAVLTGSKNALKGVGFFVGGFLLHALGFSHALYAMAGALLCVLLAALWYLQADLGKAKTKIRGRDLFAKSREINFLSAARIFLFASRDVWFVVGLPVFLSDAGWSFEEIGGFMAFWVVGYGIIQAGAPKLLRGIHGSEAAARAAKIALNVGFYYMANAVGRLLGTLLSGLVYQYYGLVACLVTASAMVLAATFLVMPLHTSGRLAQKREG